MFMSFPPDRGGISPQEVQHPASISQPPVRSRDLQGPARPPRRQGLVQAILQIANLRAHGSHFLDSLQEEAALVYAGAQLLAGAGNEREIEMLRDHSSEIEGKVSARLQVSLMTPLDAEDIQCVVLRLRHVLDSMKAAAATGMPQELAALTRISLDCSAALCGRLESLRAEMKALRPSREVVDCRRRAENLLGNLAAEMWRAEPEAALAIRRNHVYRSWYQLFRSYHKASLEIERVRLKNS